MVIRAVANALTSGATQIQIKLPSSAPPVEATQIGDGFAHDVQRRTEPLTPFAPGSRRNAR